LPKQGVRKIAVFCPGFSADCLETLEEIAISGKELFEDAGGEQFDYIPCLNTEAVWTEALCLMVAQELSGWI
jgi:ferrochelatase